MINKIKKSSYLGLSSKFYTKVDAQPLQNPSLVSVNTQFAKELNIDEKFLSSDDFISLLNGECKLDTFACAYSGHQFGYFVPNLGDGRALNLGQIGSYHLQLKGSGLTAYSRDGDGRAVLRSSIREYLMSEAMHALGIPTTRALGIITSDTKVYREKEEAGSIVLRVSPSWLRFGSFEYAYLGKNKTEQIKHLADYTIKESFPHLECSKNKYEELFNEIVKKTIKMIALWQAYGFMHGVMNTDNMSILGLTIDYGPYAFMETFNKGFTCNLSDYESRYSFENQPYMAQWNLQVLAKVFSNTCDEKTLQNSVNTFIGRYKRVYFDIMFKKLGLNKELEDDKKLVSSLLKALQADEIDYNSFFYNLSIQNYSLYKTENILSWLGTYKTRIKEEDFSLKIMKEKNPKYILRNYMLQEAIDKAELGDHSLVDTLLELAQNPFSEHENLNRYTQINNDSSIKCNCSS